MGRNSERESGGRGVCSSSSTWWRLVRAGGRAELVEATVTPSTITLAPDQLEQLADLIADRLRQEQAPATRADVCLVDAATIARELGITRATVYQHAEDLGGVRIGPAGERKRPRWRFDLEVARAAGSCYRGEQSQAPVTGADASAGAGSEPASESVRGRRSRRLPNGLPPAGSILASRPRGGD
jgi:hypothetical protein